MFFYAAPGNAQTTAPDVSKAKVRFGPLYLSPTISLTNAGIDTNVFNEWDQAAPKRDFTLTVTLTTDAWLKMGPTWFTLNSKEDFVYYKTYASERSANNTDTLRWFVPLNRLAFIVGIDYLNTRDRPGYEIDARSQRVQNGYNAAIEYRALSRTFIAAKASVQKVNFDSVATFEGFNLHDALNRTMTSATLSVRHKLTPLTTVSLDVTRDENRFTFSPFRNTNSTQTIVGAQFDPVALIKGSASFGYRDFVPLGLGVPRYRGSIAAVDASYVALGVTKFGVQANRDVQFSFELVAPYYVQTGVTGSVTQQIFGPLDIVGRAGFYQLDYRGVTGTPGLSADRTDYIHLYGGGIGYHFGPTVRLGLNIDQQRRTSTIGLRQYDDLRIGTAVTYGY
jgi:hypothetical protein